MGPRRHEREAVGVAARQAQFTACYGEYDYGGMAQYYTFDDTGTGAHYRYEAGYFTVDTGTCDRVRLSYVYPVPAQLGTKVMGELITAQTAFTGWTQATDNAGLTSTVHVEKATYGGLDVTPSLRSSCDGRGACDYTVANLGDPNPGVAKAFEVTYRCGAEPAGVPEGYARPPATKTLRLAAEAGGQTVHLTCGAFDGDLARFVGVNKSFVRDAVVPAVSTSTISLVDASTIKFTRDDGYSWNFTQTPDQQGTLQLKVLDGIPLTMGIYTQTLTLDPDGNVRGIRQADGAYFYRFAAE